MFEKRYKRLLPSLLALALAITTGGNIGTVLGKYVFSEEVAILSLELITDSAANIPNIILEETPLMMPPEQEVIQTFTINTSDLHSAYIAEVAAGKTTWNVGEAVVLTLQISGGLNQLPSKIYVNVDGVDYTIQTTQNLIGSTINSAGGITYNTETYQLTIPASMTTGDIRIYAYG